MSTLIHCNKVNFSINAKPLFNNLSITIKENDKIALVGYNGTGKTHLLKLLAGIEKPDDGVIEYANGLRLEMVSQFIDDRLLEMTLLDAISQKVKQIDEYGTYKAVSMLDDFGFQETDFTTKVADLSGGQKTKLMFAMSAVVEPDIILFDEPSNHLDANTLKFFEDFFNKNLKSAFIIVSHDRNFLDNVTNRTVFLRDQQLTAFSLPFSQALIALQEKDEADALRLQAEEKNIRRIQESAKRLAIWGKVYDNEKLARKAKSMAKRAEKLEKSKTKITEGETYRLSLDADTVKSKNMLQIGEKWIGYQHNEQFNPLFLINGLYIRPGDRIALLGDNGVGKSTLIHTLVEAYIYRKAENMTFSPQCNMGYLDQELEKIPLNESIFDAVRNNTPNIDDIACKQQLITAGFNYADLNKLVGRLSGGERSRLMFLILKLNKHNFLILDEPTNHLDIFGKMELESELINNDMTILITSHDRAFIDNVANRFWLIKHGKLEEITSSNGYYQWLNQKVIPNPKDIVKVQESAVNKAEIFADEEAILQRIVILEQNLAEDLARKPKHQKPKNQEIWKNEIEQLYAMLG
ncbi:ABC-F family ATP-binding cassette domain-containing protein [Xenorhabdus sp. DI]|uniref:ABC-F family ATP-binding cassette domain-containing protein n=1 Tax=Xenorhabdus doucetiae TaxID=351671 RepID=UPI0019BA99A8|nr:MULTISPECIES: ABC-F family ATP-binding cassette domain-containing protein [unclassified Xenorhabdus]MBD2783281.1 ABC-F family ATP-binding cassette domain-containing protein [Xenorhabdus sp. 3]MBD2788034.1 ABC-F family ATP-binding cassette domain-containing protein [Xenorhabdus sp. DI]